MKMEKDKNVRVILEVTVMGDWGDNGIGSSKTSITVQKRFLKRAIGSLERMLFDLVSEANKDYITDKDEKEKE